MYGKIEAMVDLLFSSMSFLIRWQILSVLFIFFTPMVLSFDSFAMLWMKTFQAELEVPNETEKSETPCYVNRI